MCDDLNDSNRYCSNEFYYVFKMKNGSRDGAKWNMAAGDAKWKWQLMVQKWERNQRMQNKDDQQMMKAKKWL